MPLADNYKRIAVIGPNALSEEILVSNYHGYSDHYVTIFDGIKARNPKLKIAYSPGCRLADELPLLDTISTQNLFTNRQCVQNGLMGEYFSNLNFEGTPHLVKADKQLNFKWWGNAPGNGIDPYKFSARWSGVILPPETGIYYIGARGSKSFQIFINDSLISEMNDTYQTLIEYGTIFLEKGKLYNIRIDYIQNNPENASLRLLWEIPNRDLIADALELIKNSDIAILSLGLNSQLEGEEMKVKVKGFNGGDRESIDLPESQKHLIKAIAKTGKPIIIILTNGSAISFPKEAKLADAIIEAWYPGEAGGTAVASVLWGDYNPAGRLPVTFYNSVDDLPPFEDYTMKGRTYKFFKGKTQFDFGYGLSYSTFKYKGLNVKKNPNKNNEIEYCFNITNTGNYDGEEVCQLYIKDKDNKSISLQAFERVHLKAGETKQITLHFDTNEIENLKGNVANKTMKAQFIIGGSKPTKSNSRSCLKSNIVL